MAAHVPGAAQTAGSWVRLIVAGLDNGGIRLSVQPGEPTVPVLLDTRRSSHLAACGNRYRARRHQNQIRDAKAVRIRYRRGDITLDDRQLVRGLPRRFTPFLEFDNDDKLLLA